MATQGVTKRVTVCNLVTKKVTFSVVKTLHFVATIYFSNEWRITTKYYMKNKLDSYFNKEMMIEITPKTTVPTTNLIVSVWFL